MIERYISLLAQLKKLSQDTELKVLEDSADAFITDNVNFFTKSFMITLCAYLESYVKDLSMLFIDHINIKLADLNLPHNLVRWSVLKKDKLLEFNDSEYKYENLKIKIKKKELDEFISGSPHRTEVLFRKFGIELYKDEKFNDLKEKINSIVVKRNKIVHHNDNASDLSFVDIEANIMVVEEYILNLNEIIKSKF